MRYNGGDAGDDPKPSVSPNASVMQRGWRDKSKGRKRQEGQRHSSALLLEKVEGSWLQLPGDRLRGYFSTNIIKSPATTAPAAARWELCFLPTTARIQL